METWGFQSCAAVLLRGGDENLAPTLPKRYRSLLCGCKLRGFDFILFFGISIGIKLRMIDISKKITFLFLLNV